jgi:hypothetical protein
MVARASPSPLHRINWAGGRTLQVAAACWVVDADVVVWTHDTVFPQAVTATLEWSPAGAAEPFTLSLDTLFRAL